MKHATYFLIVLIFSVFISSCSKDELVEENNELPLKSNQKSGVIDNEDNKDSLPKLKFILKGEGTNIYTIVLKDPAQTTPVRFSGRIRYQDQSSSRAMEGSFEVFFSIEDFNAVGKAIKVPFPAPVENQILDVNLEYREGDVVVKTFEYSLFVFADGKSALQKPKITNWSYVSRGIEKESIRRGMVRCKIVDDPANEVASVDVRFSEPFDGPKPTQLSFSLNGTNKKENKMEGLISFTGDPTGFTYSVACIMKDTKGNAIGEPQNLTITVKDEAASIHNIYIREVKNENGLLTHEMAGIVLNIKPERLEYVEVTFNKPFVGPAPEKIIWRMRKRPELLYQAWDDVINDYISEIQNNPLACDNSAESNPLFNQEKSAVGYTYSVTAAMFDKNGKQIGQPQSFNVTVTGETIIKEPVLQRTQLLSIDGGKTWNYEAIIQDNGQDLEKVQVEFIKPYEGPEPALNLIDLYLVGEKEGNIKVYSNKVEFKGTPAEGNSYSTNLILYKKGFDSGTKMLQVHVCHF